MTHGKLRKFWTAALLLAGMSGAGSTEAGELSARWFSRTYPWHHNYYDPAWGPAPHALVVPNGVRRHTEYNWGAAGTETLPIRHEYLHEYPRNRFGRVVGVQPAPVQPSSTNQMGTYYLRAPR